MLQFYFLSIMLNMITGCILIYSSEKPEIFSDGNDLAEIDSNNEGEKRNSAGNIFKRIFGSDLIAEDSLFQLVVGILTAFTGLVKILSSVDGIFLFGDLLPGCAGLCGGLSLLFSYYNTKADVSLKIPSFFEKLFVDCRKIVGILCIIIGVIHFIVPGVLFL